MYFIVLLVGKGLGFIKFILFFNIFISCGNLFKFSFFKIFFIFVIFGLFVILNIGLFILFIVISFFLYFLVLGIIVLNFINLNFCLFSFIFFCIKNMGFFGDFNLIVIVIIRKSGIVSNSVMFDKIMFKIFLVMIYEIGILIGLKFNIIYLLLILMLVFFMLKLFL